MKGGDIMNKILYDLYRLLEFIFIHAEDIYFLICSYYIIKNHSYCHKSDLENKAQIKMKLPLIKRVITYFYVYKYYYSTICASSSRIINLDLKVIEKTTKSYY